MLTRREQWVYDNLHIVSQDILGANLAHKSTERDDYRVLHYRRNDTVKKWRRMDTRYCSGLGGAWLPVCEKFANIVRLKTWGMQ